MVTLILFYFLSFGLQATALVGGKGGDMDISSNIHAFFILAIFEIAWFMLHDLLFIKFAL